MGSQKPHAVCMPCPGQGHINAMLGLAKLLHFKGFHITFVHTDYNYNRILNSSDGGATVLDGLDGFRFETIQTGGINNVEMQAVADAMRDNFLAPFRSLVLRLNDSSSGVPPVTCIVSDAFTSYTLDVAKELRIPDVFFCSAAPCGYMAVLHYKQFVDSGIVPLDGESHLSDEYLDTLVDWIPGLKHIRLRDLPSLVRATSRDDIMLDFIIAEAQRAVDATAIIFNTFDDLEQDVLNAMSSMLPPLYTIGPLTLLCDEQLSTPPWASLRSSYIKDDDCCIKWLDEREIGSVMYVSFGSTAVMSSEQLMELAWGLANADHYFLWIIRPDLLKGEHVTLPQEFWTAIQGKGLLASWCSQEQVLKHPSVGGFLTHSGWNSIMENMAAGLPMICWACLGDQMIVRRYVCDEWEIGVELDRDVKREQVEELVKEVLGGDKGKAMRNRAAQWKERAMRATTPGGSSFVNLDRMIQEVLLPQPSLTAAID